MGACFHEITGSLDEVRGAKILIFLDKRTKET